MCLFSGVANGQGLDYVSINYQDIAYNASQDKTSVKVDYDGQCTELTCNFFSLDQLLQGRKSIENQISMSITDPFISLTNNNSDSSYFSIVVKDENGTICSDAQSHQTFYNIRNNGKSLIVSAL